MSDCDILPTPPSTPRISPRLNSKNFFDLQHPFYSYDYSETFPIPTHRYSLRISPMRRMHDNKAKNSEHENNNSTKKPTCSHKRCCHRLRILNPIESTLKDYTKLSIFGCGWHRKSPGPFDGRSGHAMCTNGKKNRVYLMGGLDSSSQNTNDVYMSVDGGNSWTARNSNSPWSPRMGHGVVSCPKMSFFNTSEGEGFSITNHGEAKNSTASDNLSDNDDGLIIVGGWDCFGSFVNDVWRSNNGGKTWFEIHRNLGESSVIFSPRCNFGFVSTPNGKLILCGGLGTDNLHLNDVWISHDYGISWECVHQHASWGVRWNMGCVVLDSQICEQQNYHFQKENSNSISKSQKLNSVMIFGGTSIDGFVSDVWRSDDDGKTWYEVTSNAEFGARGGMAVVQHMPSGVLVMLGGEVSVENRYVATNSLRSIEADQCSSDVWVSVDVGASWSKVATNGTLMSPIARYENKEFIFSQNRVSSKTTLSLMKDDQCRCIPLPHKGQHTRRWQARCLVRSVALNDDTLLLVGGELRSEKRVNDVWVCKMATDMFAARQHAKMLSILGSKLQSDGFTPTQKRRKTENAANSSASLSRSQDLCKDEAFSRLLSRSECVPQEKYIVKLPDHLWRFNVMPFVMAEDILTHVAYTEHGLPLI